MAFNEMEEFVKQFMPASPQYKIVDVKVDDVSQNVSNYRVTVRVGVRCKEKFLEWLAEHQKLSACTYRVLKTVPTDGKYILFKAAYRCRHNTRPSRKVKKPSSKHTGCKANMKVKIKAVPEKTSSKDPLIRDFPCIITIDSFHNHQIFPPPALPSQNVIKKDLHEKDLDEKDRDEEVELTFPELSAGDNVCVKESVWQKLQSFCENVMSFVDSEPQELEKAVDAACESLQQIKTASALVSALNNFGKAPEIRLLTIPTAYTFQVQPAIVTQQTVNIGTVRHVVSANPSKRIGVAERGHDQHNRFASSGSEPPQKKIKLQRLLPLSVTANGLTAKS